MYDLLIKDLIEIFNNNGFTAIVLNNTIVSKKIKDEQIGLYTKLLYGVVEKKLLLDYYVQPFTKGKRIKPYFKCAIRIGIYAVEYLNIANHYIINELVEVVKHKDYNASKLVNGIFRSYLRDGKQSLDSLDEENKLSLILSLPYALTKYLYAQYGNKLLEYFDNNNTFNTYSINYLKINQE
jgi:16S rRNA (cytosine967-C5)-methyltransferase